MNEGLVEFLNRTKPNQETIEVATRTFLSELTEDMPPSKMKRNLVGAATDRQAVERALLELEASPQDRLQASLTILVWAWENLDNRARIQAAFRGAQSKLPAIEAGLLALVAMYGMYLMTTAGRRRENRTIKIAQDGTFEETTTIEYERPTGSLSMIAKLFGSGKGIE